MQNDERQTADDILTRAKLARKSFDEKFWYAEGQYCYDVMDETGSLTPVRPDQLLAISLPFPLLEGERAKAVLSRIRGKLFTPFGLRSLSPDDTRYQGFYVGDTLNRDSAYHQGTVWSWLMGPFIEGCLKTYGESFRREARDRTRAISVQLNETCIRNCIRNF